MRHKAFEIFGPFFRTTQKYWEVFIKGGDLEEISSIYCSFELLGFLKNRVCRYFGNRVLEKPKKLVPQFLLWLNE